MIPCRTSRDLIDFGDHYIQVKDNEIVDSESLKSDHVRSIQVPAVYWSTLRETDKAQSLELHTVALHSKDRQRVSKR